MNFLLKRRLYESSPPWVKRIAGSIPFAWIAGPHYRRVAGQVRALEVADRENIRAVQEVALGRVLAFAVDQVPMYRHLRGIVSRHRPFEALRDFPLVDKEQLQARMREFLPRDFDRIPHYEITTGGSSGNQLRLFVDNCSASVEVAYMHAMWRRVGYDSRCRKATFRGVAFPRLQPGVFWQENPLYHELQVSPFHMSSHNMAAYVDALVRFRPQFLHGYPSAIDALAGFIVRHGLSESLRQIQAALLASEACYPAQREQISKAFRTRVFSWYGHSERIILGGECEHNHTYHAFPDYGILEILDVSGKGEVAQGERGELVGTGLLNRSLPLIRYRTGDSARRLPPQCECGRCWDRFDEVEGRWKQDVLIGQSGARISVAALNMHGPLFERVTRYQYFQKTPGVCELRLMVADGFRDSDRAAIEAAYAAKARGELSIKPVVVEDIPLTARSKHRFLVSEIPGAVDTVGSEDEIQRKPCSR
jgi:phenylacetate-CoA ligase